MELQRKEMSYLTMQLQLWSDTMGVVVKDQIVREETHYGHFMGYSFQIAAMNLLYAPPHRQAGTYHGLCYTSCRVNEWMNV